ncbi:hypothetical protein C2G38_2117469 [Gigaspora rosea]|uniref:Uncharacterized protein n=1 Tax=Gigaspora rosea TaxID=44941 RepID=A0A397U6K4_9GLOM|nr:hypothetical protein C2G38_2117469 [Gigaspora rosea]
MIDHSSKRFEFLTLKISRIIESFKSFDQEKSITIARGVDNRFIINKSISTVSNIRL